MKEVIRVENLSKAYRVGQKEQSHDTLFGQIADIITSPVRNFKNLRSLTKFNGKDDPTVHWALKDINFTVHEGEVLGIIGHNGAGKSTLLKILSRVTEPTSGRVRIRGRIGALLEVGTGFHPELTGRENIYMNGTILGMTKKEIDRKLDEIIDFAGVEKFIDTPVKFYSSGMKVRLGFAVAAHLEPEILVIDEVLAVGDAEFQKKCLGKMKDVSTAGRTVLFVSHNLAAVEALCSRGIVLSKGIKVFEGNQSESIKFYTSSVKSLLTSVQMWDFNSAPGDERVKLLKMMAKPFIGDIISISSGIVIEYELFSYVERQPIEIYIVVKNYENIVMFKYSKVITEPENLRIGYYKVFIKIPPFLLNEGIYSVDTWLGIGGGFASNKLVDVLGFEILPSAVDHLYIKLPGILRPKIEYESIYIK